MTPRALRWLALPLGAAWLLLATAPALAADAGRITGRVVQRTPGGASPAGAEVVLHVFRAQAHTQDRPSQASAEGAFAFDGLETGGDYAYQVTAGFAGTAYASDLLRFAPGETEQRVEVAVFETTDQDPGLRVRRATVLLAAPDSATRTIQAVELATLENPGDRTYLPSATGPAGPMGLLRFPLPPQAGDLRPGPGLDEAEIAQVDRGFATSLPVSPGTREVLFSYRFPYRPGRLVLTRSVPYPTDELRLLLPPAGPTLESPDFQAGEPLQLSGQTYRVYIARDLAAGAQVELTLGSLPGRWPFNLPLDDVPVPVWGALGVTVGALLAAGYALRARGEAPPPGSTTAERRQALVEALAALDDAYAAGRLPEETYHTRRVEAKAELLAVLRATAATPQVLAADAGELDGARRSASSAYRTLAHSTRRERDA